MGLIIPVDAGPLETKVGVLFFSYKLLEAYGTLSIMAVELLVGSDRHSLSVSQELVSIIPEDVII